MLKIFLNERKFNASPAFFLAFVLNILSNSIKVGCIVLAVSSHPLVSAELMVRDVDKPVSGSATSANYFFNVILLVKGTYL